MLIAVATGRTSTGSVARVNRNNTHSCTPSLVLDKVSQLIESPISKLKTHFSVHNRSPLTNTRKVFKGDCLTRDSRRFDKATADIVIHPTSEPRLTAAQLLKVSLRRFRLVDFCCVLKSCLQFPHSATEGTNRFSAVLVSLGIRGNLNNAKVYTQKLGSFALRGFWNVADHHQVKLTIDKAKIAFAFLSQKHFLLKLSNGKRNLHAPGNCPERNLTLLGKESQDPRIVGDRTRGAKGSLRRFVQFIRVGDFGITANNQLRSQRELFPDVVITGGVKGKLLETLVLPGVLRHAVASLIRLFECGEKHLLLLARGKELDLSNELHKQQFTITLFKYQYFGNGPKSGSRFLPRLKPATAKAGGFLGGFS